MQIKWARAAGMALHAGPGGGGGEGAFGGTSDREMLCCCAPSRLLTTVCTSAGVPNAHMKVQEQSKPSRQHYQIHAEVHSMLTQRRGVPGGEGEGGGGGAQVFVKVIRVSCRSMQEACGHAAKSSTRLMSRRSRVPHRQIPTCHCSRAIGQQEAMTSLP